MTRPNLLLSSGKAAFTDCDDVCCAEMPATPGRYRVTGLVRTNSLAWREKYRDDGGWRYMDHTVDLPDFCAVDLARGPDGSVSELDLQALRDSFDWFDARVSHEMTENPCSNSTK